jgi:O-glycosyl hydrolase
MKRRRSYWEAQNKPQGFYLRKAIEIAVICLFFAQAAFAATGTVYYNDPCQQLEGFGGAACYDVQTMANHPSREAVYDLLFRDLRLDVLRIKNTYEISSADITATGLIVAAGKSRNPSLKIELVPWSPPAYLKSNNDVNGGPGGTATLKKSGGNYMYAEYANWWATSLTGSGGFSSVGVYPDYISIQNEPDWGIQDQACRFNPTEDANYAGYDKAFEAVYNRMDGNVSPMPKMLAPETAGLVASQTYINALNSIGQLGNIYGFSHHLYDFSYSNPDSAISAMQSFHNNYGYKPLFMTEYTADGTPTFTHALLLAQHIYNCLVYEGVTSYYHWSLFRNGGYTDGGMINLIPGGGYEVRDLYWFFKHYAYFTDPGWYRVGTSTSSSNLRMTAFKDPDDSRLTIVILNKSTSSESLTLTINGFPPSDSVVLSDVYRSSQTEHWSYIGTFNPSQSLSLPAQSITTISLANCMKSGSWKPLNSGTDQDVWTVGVYNGELIAGGDFTMAGGFPANHIARWDGSSWQPLGDGLDSTVFALTTYNGEMIAGGWFTTAGSTSAAYIARWNGSDWQPLDSGMNSGVFALTVYDGQLIAGGDFTTAGESEAGYIARWNGSSWQLLGSGMDGLVLALTVYNGELIAGGYFTSAGGSAANYIARWDGSTWQPLDSGMDGPVYALTVYNGELIAGGEFTTAGGSAADYIARWDGSTWQPLGSGLGSYIYLNGLTVYNGELIAGGYFTTAGGSTANYIARWDGSSWQSLGSGMDNYVYGVTAYNGKLIAGGGFTTAGGVTSTHLAGWGVPVTYTGDLNHDCVVDWFDLKWLVDNWLDEDCMYNGWCYEADLNYDFIVNFEDFAKMGNSWLMGL